MCMREDRGKREITIISEMFLFFLSYDFFFAVAFSLLCLLFYYGPARGDRAVLLSLRSGPCRCPAGKEQGMQDSLQCWLSRLRALHLPKAPAQG